MKYDTRVQPKVPNEHQFKNFSREKPWALIQYKDAILPA